MMNNKYSNIKWKQFIVSEVFQVENSKAYHKNNLEIVKNGKTAYVTRTNQSNGLETFVNIDSSFVVNKGDTITLGAENADFFYQPIPYITGNKMYIISHNRINKYIGLFLVNVFRKSVENTGYGYGKGLTGTRFKRKNILLPSTPSGNPDWDFMEEIMRETEKNVTPNIEFNKHEITDNRDLNELEWSSFFINELFIIQRGKRLIKKNQINGETPYVSSTALQNGIDNFIANNSGVRIFQDCLTIANSGSVGEVFYHPYHFVASDHVTHIKKDNLNKYEYLFIATSLKNIGEKYSFNREISDKRLKREKVLLPVTKDDEPDWEFMEQFMKRMENKIMKNVD